MTTVYELMRAGYRTDAESNNLNEKFRDRLGMDTRYAPARLAIALSLSDSKTVGDDFLEDKEKCDEIKGHQLFGQDAPTNLISLIVQHKGTVLDKKGLQSAVAAHWARGLRKLEKIWQNAEEDYERFLSLLYEGSGLCATSPAVAPLLWQQDIVAPSSVVAPIPATFHLGKSLIADKEIKWTVNAAGGSPHLAVMGETNTGKTHFALNFARGMQSQNGCAVCVFDMGKGDIAANKEFVDGIGATVLSSPQRPIPLDIFHVADKNNTDIQTMSEYLCDSLAHLMNNKMGDVQRGHLQDIAPPLLAGDESASLDKIRQTAEQHYITNGMRPDSVISALKQATKHRLFAPEQTPADFFRRSWVFDLHSASASVQRFVAFMVLTAYCRHFLSAPDALKDETGNTKINSLLVVDEARKVLGYKHPALVDIVRMTRSKGVVAVLISQSPDDYNNEDNDFISDIGANVCFRTNASDATIKRVFKQKTQVSSLERGTCIVRLPGVSGIQQVKVW